MKRRSFLQLLGLAPAAAVAPAVAKEEVVEKVVKEDDFLEDEELYASAMVSPSWEPGWSCTVTCIPYEPPGTPRKRYVGK